MLRKNMFLNAPNEMSQTNETIAILQKIAHVKVTKR